MTKSIQGGLFGLKRLTGCALAAALLFAGMSALAANVAKIGEETFGSLADAFAAVQSGETVVILDGTHDCTETNAFAKLGGKAVTLKGESQNGTVLNMGNGEKEGVIGSDLTLENMTLKFDHSSSSGSPMYDHTFYHPSSQTFRRVTIVGQIDIMDNTLFDTCTFTGKVNDKDEYLLWCYACTAELVDCTFEGSGTKGPVKLYNEGGQCGLKVSGTTFEEVGAKGCAVYSTNQYPEKNVYEITVGEGVTVTAAAENGLIRSSDVGLTVINPTKDEQGKYTGGTFESEQKSAKEIIELTRKYAGEGFAPVIDPETGKVVVGEKTYARVTSFARTGTDVTLGWEPVDGLQYQVECSDSLDEAAVWTPYGMPSATSPVTLPDQTASCRFYRVCSIEAK